MRINTPPKKMREKFFLAYELEGCQKAVNLLTEYYGVRRMKIILDGRKVKRGHRAHYSENKAYFTKRGLKKRTVLHELYHHLVYVSDLEMPVSLEEKKATSFSRKFFKD